MAAKAKSGVKAGVVIKAVIVIAAAVGLSMYVQRSLRERAAITEYNRITRELYEQQKYPEAAAALEKLLPTVEGEVARHTREELARCYLQQGTTRG